MKTLKNSLLLSFLATSLLFFQSCTEDDPAKVPTVTTGATENITLGRVKISGTVTSTGGATITAKGIAYGTTHNPTIASDTTNQGEGEDAFIATLDELAASTTYYARAYATNQAGTAYGAEVEFTTTSGLPVVTLEISNILYDQLNISAAITDQGASYVTMAGVYYSKTNALPTSSDSKYESNGLGIESTSTGITQLQPGTHYYFRAVATNSQGTSYSAVQEINTLNPPNVTDGDGTTYPSVVINGRVWMAANMSSTHFMNGDAIPTTTGSTSGETNPVYTWAYNNDNANASIYGRLYTYYAATDSRKLCPTGWHVPTYADINSLGADGAALMATGTDVWTSAVGTDTKGFNATGAGMRYSDPAFTNLKDRMVLQSATAYSTNSNYSETKIMGPTVGGYLSNYQIHRGIGVSVRCVLD